MSRILEKTTAILDNSSFAGVMRLFAPYLKSHRVFLDKYPEHKLVDQVSLADFLTSICIYDDILLESSSWASVYNAGDVQKIPDKRGESWVHQLKKLLPDEISKHIWDSPLSGDEITENERAQELAVDIFCSELYPNVQLKRGEKIPGVYTSPSYVYRKNFLIINEAKGGKLNEEQLAQAMFLHRGLYLQAQAQEDSATYVPYLYRGRMLSSLPPLIYLEAIQKDIFQILHESDSGNKNYLKEINKFYYELLNKLTWVTIDDRVPFIGASILATAKDSVEKAFEIALNIREKGELRDLVRELDLSVQRGDRVDYDMFLSFIKKKLAQASRHIGDNTTNPYLKSFYSLATFWMPVGAKKSIDALIDLVPSKIKHFLNRIASTLLNQDSFQILFINHVKAIRSSKK